MSGGRAARGVRSEVTKVEDGLMSVVSITRTVTHTGDPETSQWTDNQRERRRECLEIGRYQN